ncbi:MAG TPA: hypothetical protein VF786_04215 [Terriglobales bacterium]
MKQDFDKLLQDRNRMLQEGARVMLDYLNIDLDTCMTMARIASESTDDPEKRNRNRNNARRGYDAVTYFSTKLDIGDTERKQLRDKLHRLRSALEQLGEKFPSQ